jgi:hypothetical protein
MNLKKHIWLIIFIALSISFSNAQTVRSVTNAEGAVSFDGFNLGSSVFEQSLFWRMRFNKSGKEKDSYFFHSIYFRDSVVGVKLIGFEFNLLHEAFESSRRLNKFRHWNIIRLGMSINAEHNFWHEYYAPEDAFEYFNANFYMKYYHIPKRTRGDRTTKYTIGAWGFIFDYDFHSRIYGDFFVKAFPLTKVHFRYKRHKDYAQLFGLLFEIELNMYGYDKHGVESTKDIYNGTSLILGLEYNDLLSSVFFNFGIKMDYRNH